MTAHDTTIDRTAASTWGIWCTCGWSIHPLSDRRTADQAAQAHKRQAVEQRGRVMR